MPGFLTMASLIVAIGAQNAFVLRSGLARRNVGLVVAVCAVSDAVLVVVGVLGVGGIPPQQRQCVERVAASGVRPDEGRARGGIRPDERGNGPRSLDPLPGRSAC